MSILNEPETSKRGRGLLVLAAGLLLAVAGGLAWYLLRQPAAEPGPPPSPAAQRAPAAPVTPTPSSAPAASAGTLQVEASVQGASVAIDGDTVGPVPQRRALGAGTHRVRVTRDGYTPWEREAYVVPGHTVRLVARLDPEAARLSVDADVPHASVFLDRKFLGNTPVQALDVTPGSHRLNVSADGYEMYAETLDVAAGPRTVMVRFKEVRLDEKLAVVHKHGIGSCRGTLFATTAGLRYDASDAAHSFSAPFSSLEPLQVDYLRKNLRLKLRGGRTYNFTADSADALLSFQKAVEAARKRL